MRQLIIQVPQGEGKKVLDIAKSLNGANLAKFEATNSDEPIDVVLVYVSNQQVEKLVAKLEELPQVNFTLLPTGVMPLHPPASEAPQQVTNVEERSPIEIFLSGLQSVGSWRGFLGYAAMAGFVVWIGLYTDTIYLLTAAMLIAPFAGPAMNLAIATARGDRQLLWRSIVRYFAALTVTILVAGILSLIVQQKIATSLMIERSQISSVAVLLPLAAGAAGALNLVQSERSSLVSGAATGMLVAASLAPPAGIVGMGSAIGRWDLVISGLFLLLLQLVGINLTAGLLFRFFGLSARGVRYTRGKGWLFPVTLGLTLLGLALLLTWQFNSPPDLQRSTLAQRADAQIQEVVSQNPLVNLVETNARFTRSQIPGQNTLLTTVYVQRRQGVSISAEEIRSRLTQAIQSRLQQQNFDVIPLVDAIVLEPPASK
ncbi:MAG: TIGR00341 family protein [Chlorogloeopsis fritschii C42_A2020_084]|uniref:TIGR00341 family protein n=1 Tax=Chlorogloeopsis fritschii TaxID=1124 RepID=UPI0019FC5343|nr:TIGR00341 family protein [Chlorogloeopsis fritschii]MBF2007516.1 TIGR00341 family protein [Chlorogloeopsis fritschii C42_A2020_084]